MLNVGRKRFHGFHTTYLHNVSHSNICDVCARQSQHTKCGEARRLSPGAVAPAGARVLRWREDATQLRVVEAAREGQVEGGKGRTRGGAERERRLGGRAREGKGTERWQTSKQPKDNKKKI